MRALAIAVGVAGLGWLAPAAVATDFCVAPNTTCGGTAAPTLEAALTSAGASVSADRIFLGEATYTSAAATGFAYVHATFPVEIVGAGVGRTVITSPLGGSSRVLLLTSGAGSSIHDLTVRIPQSAASGLVGLETDRLATDIEVTEAAAQSNPHVGVRLDGAAARVERSVVSLGGTVNTTGVLLQNGGESVRDSTIAARTAVSAPNSDASPPPSTVERTRMRAVATGIFTTRHTTNVTDSLITVSEAGAAGAGANTQSGQNTTLNLDGVTIVATGANSTGISADNGLATTQSSQVNVVDTIIRGVDVALQRIGAAPGTASLTASYSDYDPSGNVSPAGNGTLIQANVTNVGDARFVDAGTGDFRLRFDSPLIDVGEPSPPSTATDLAGLPRLVDGDATPGARRDVGAFEYQARTPVAAIGGPATVAAGVSATFSGAGSSDADAGDTLTFAWSVDGAAAGSGPALAHTFASAGGHTVALTVTDPTGRVATASVSVTVPDTTPPVVSSLAASPRRVRSGAPVRFTFGLDEAAAVTVRIERRLPGRRVGASCRAVTGANRKRARCTRFVLVTRLTAKGAEGPNTVRFRGRVRGRALTPGTYRAVVTAADAAGNRSAPRRAAFAVHR